MQRSTRWTLAVSAVAAVAGLTWAFAPRPVRVETAVVEKGRFEQSIEEDGRTRVRDPYTLSTPVAARLLRVTLREGDAVKAGQVVAMLSPVMPSLQDERSVREAQARLKAADAGVAVARARAEGSRAALALARTQLARSERLAREGFTANASLDQDRLRLETAQREFEAAVGQQEVAAQERAQAAAALQPLSRDGAGAGHPVLLRAPVDGVVLRVARTSEGTLAAGSAVMDIGDPGRMEVLAELLTSDAVQARPGTPAVIEGWGGPAVPARVRLVEPAAFKKVSALGVEEQRVNVLLDVETPPAEWRRMGDGFRVVARIITTTAEDATLVPVGALFPRPEGGMAVYRFQDGRARLQAVELGGRNARSGWVRSGLKPGDQVITYPPPAVTDGARVAQRKP